MLIGSLFRYMIQIPTSGDAAAIEKATRMFCQSTCVTRDIPACTSDSLDSFFQSSVDKIKKGIMHAPA